MELKKRIQLLANLGQKLLENKEIFQSVFLKAKRSNPWFSFENQEASIQAIAQNYLNEEKLLKWTKLYDEKNFAVKSKNVGLICAGNIPLVGIHDLIAVFISGHSALLKLSTKDEHLMKFIIQMMYEIDESTANYIKIVDRLKDFDAVIATGSNNSARYFEYYFRNVPLLLRKNRTSVAVINGTETNEEMKNLGQDVFAYFGLGCRNVSKIYIPSNYEVTKIFEHFQYLSELKNHNKYGNNFEYNLALYLINQEQHLTNDFFILKEDKSLFSRLSVLHYEYYEHEKYLQEALTSQSDNIQCIVGNADEYVPFGKAQSPELWDYADGVDTLTFLSTI